MIHRINARKIVRFLRDDQMMPIHSVFHHEDRVVINYGGKNVCVCHSDGTISDNGEIYPNYDSLWK